MSQPKLVPDSELDYDSDLIFTHKGEIFTGISYEETPELGRSEISYREGMQEGWARDWYPSGVLSGEGHYIQGVPHGLTREFDPAGNLIEEVHYDHGVAVLTRNLHSEGQVIEVKELDPNGDTAQYLERIRIERPWGPPPGID